MTDSGRGLGVDVFNEASPGGAFRALVQLTNV